MKLTDRKLGRERAQGQCWPDGRIEIDPRLTARKRLEIVLHEALHFRHADWTESRVVAESRKLAAVLWRDGWRRVCK